MADNNIKNNVVSEKDLKKSLKKPNYVVKKYGFFITVKVTINNTTGRDNLQGYRISKKAQKKGAGSTNE